MKPSVRNIKKFLTLEDFYNSIAWNREKPVKVKYIKKKRGKMRRILTPLLLLSIISPIHAADIVTINGATIEKVRLTSEWYGGGCLAFVSSYPGSKWCAANWVSFNCDEGKDNRPSRATLKFNYALIAMDGRYLVDVTINQSKIVNGHCSVDNMIMNKEKAAE